MKPDSGALVRRRRSPDVPSPPDNDPRVLVARRAADAAPKPPEEAANAAGKAESHEFDVLFRKTWWSLGGRKFWPAGITNDSDVHAAAVKGVPYGSLLLLLSNFTAVSEADVARVLHLSPRTLRRHAEAPDKPMPSDTASKSWQLAETLVKAIDVFGGKEAAEQWLSSPAVSLNGQRPIDMLQTFQGAKVLGDYLGRLEYGVYA